MIIIHMMIRIHIMVIIMQMSADDGNNNADDNVIFILAVIFVIVITLMKRMDNRKIRNHKTKFSLVRGECDCP